MKLLNQGAYEIVQHMVVEADSLCINTRRMDCGALLIDAGIEACGSYEAGRLFAEACLAGLGKVDFCDLNYGDLWLPGVRVVVDHPLKACMASQYAGWAVKVKKSGGESFFAMGSGPARANYGAEELLTRLGYSEAAEVAVLALESRQMPDDAVALWIAEKCGVSTENLCLLAAPTASLVGSIQVAARIVETGLHKLELLDFDLKAVKTGFGVCPIAPVAMDDLSAIGRTNDAVLYGGSAFYTATAGRKAVAGVLDKLPSSSSRDYGSPFGELFKRYDYDFYKIDPMLFSPAQVTINDLESGETFRCGRINSELLEREWLT